jgi:hypothetical protein
MFDKLATIFGLFSPVVIYDICLSDYECLLPKLASIVSASYVPGSFDIIDERFHQSGEDTLEWHLIGELGQLVIYLEKYEGYYRSSFKGSDPQFQMGKKLLWEAYIEQGGNPNLQRKP